MIIVHSVLAALCLFGMLVSKNNMGLLALNTLCLGLNIGVVISFITGRL